MAALTAPFICVTARAVHPYWSVCQSYWSVIYRRTAFYSYPLSLSLSLWSENRQLTSSEILFEEERKKKKGKERISGKRYLFVSRIEKSKVLLFRDYFFGYFRWSESEDWLAEKDWSVIKGSLLLLLKIYFIILHQQLLLNFYIIIIIIINNNNN